MCIGSGVEYAGLVPAHGGVGTCGSTPFALRLHTLPRVWFYGSWW